MKKLLRIIGCIIFWCGWPVLYVYFRRSERTRVLIINGSDMIGVKTWVSSADRWSLPGGGLHKGEDPLLGALREAREETGLALQPDAVRPLCTAINTDKGFHYTCHYFVAVLPEKVVLTRQLHEVAETAWISMNTLPHELFPEVVRVLAAYKSRI
jgi:8-oxo-dGTP pyrophosphatase MutT (NUDIX family)